jgi:hypothetical protein
MQKHNEIILITTYTDESPMCQLSMSVDTFW